MWFMRILLLVVVVVQLNAEKTMWEIIEESNQKFHEHKKEQQDDNGERLIGGDIFMTTKDFAENRKILSAPTKYQLQPVFDYHRKYWKRKIPYVIKSELRQGAAVIRKSLTTIEKASCLKFFEVRNGGGGYKHWLEFYSGIGCFSGIGRRYWKKYSTKVSLGNGCDREPIIVHEVLHALGFFHEQSRTDRDSYVNIYLQWVQKDMQSNFDKNHPADTDYQGTPYDLKSIMQYGKGSFRKRGYRGNTMEYKYNPGLPLGGPFMTELDKLELNRKYQCPHVDLDGKKVRGVMTGWSSWSPMTPCFENWRKECSKGRYRFCVDSDNCPGANLYGTQEEVTECSKEECEADKNAVDGIWGPWSEYGRCDSKCGYGIHKRTRQCNNPSPKGKGKKCEGFGIERKLCRKQRCDGPGPLDEDFENGFGSWTAERFSRQQGRVPGFIDGPKNDYTSIITGKGGYYAMAMKPATFIYKHPSRYLTSKPLTAAKSGCLSFQYLLNGFGYHKTMALSVFVKTPDGQYINTAFAKGGHHGESWNQGMVKLINIVEGTKIIFEAKFDDYGGSVVAIDDIFYDNIPCPDGLDRKECKDTDPKCVEYSTKNYCSTHWNYMLRKCCKTCQDPKFKIDTKIVRCVDAIEWMSKCPNWAKSGECNKSSAKWMAQNCCQSCKSMKPKTTPSATCTDAKDWAKKCPGWAKNGECNKKSAKWMATNCCLSCKSIKTTSPTTVTCNDGKGYLEKCENWAKEGYCAHNTWMPKNCCASCKKFCVNRHGKEAECEKWAADKKNDYCKKNKFMKEKCCASCYKHNQKN